VAGLNRRRLLDHFRQHYGPRSLTVAVLGPLEPERISAKLQSLFADLPAASGAPSRDRDLAAVSAAPPHTEPKEVFQFITKDQGRLVLGFPGVALRDPDRYALEILAEVLGGAGGRMGAAGLRALGVLPDQAGAVSHEGVDPGYFALYLAARPDTLDAIVPALRGEVRGLIGGGVTEEEVTRARRILVGDRALSLERRGAVAMAVALNGVFGGAGRAYRRDVDALSRVTAADVTRAARRILDPRREVLAVVRPRHPDAPAAATGQPPSTRTSTGLKVQSPPPRYTSR
jgi:zinc protease